ncbi:MAG: RHS repeat-associated core domain-containing protein, partial [Dysgonomonas sp.]|nr:RHS repeat-associated core domain-containing protein [Dysgonomonas sp.]
YDDGKNQPYKYNGKELDEMHGVNMYDYSARYKGDFGFTTVDPLAEKYYSWSPYVYVMNNPLKYIDLDGCSTYVIQNEDGTYRVVGGNLDDDDLNIYAINFKDGKYAGISSIGVTTSITSFYDSYANNEEGAWAIGSIINPKDNSGKQFLDNLVKDDPEIVDYMENAKKYQKYDFKSTNGTDNVVYEEKDYYRGMSVGQTKGGQTIYTSAKDIGNIGAGWVAGSHNIPWIAARYAFDKLQSKQDGKSSVELPSSQNAQFVGWQTGKRDYSRHIGAPLYKYPRSIPNILKGLKYVF